MAHSPPEGAITRVSEREATIRRGALEAWLADPDALARTARVVPRMGDDGQVEGLRLQGIGRGSPLAELGFRNDDTVLEVAGRSIASPAAALEASDTLQHADAIPVRLERGGEVFVHTVRVVDDPPRAEE